MPMLASMLTVTPSMRERRLERRTDPFSDLGAHRSAAVGQQNGELVPAQAGDGVARAEHLGDPVRRLDEQLITVVVAQGVVDLLEPIEVDHHHDRLGPLAVGRR